MPSVSELKHFKYLKKWIPEEKYIPSIRVVTCFLQVEDKFLVLQRARNDVQFGLWGIPGGKLMDAESPVEGLVREVQEETTIVTATTSFKLLGTALSRTACDGEYGLYVYHTRLSHFPSVSINNCEHSAFAWVTLAEFQALSLLTAQGEAFKLVQNKLEEISKWIFQ